MIRVSSLLFWFSLALITSLALYGTSNRVQDLGKQLRSLNTRIEAEQANIHVLKAEWVYLASPSRIETAARKYLAMHPTSLNQVTSLENLPELLPTRTEAMAGVTVKAPPLANVGTTLPLPAAPDRPGKTAEASDVTHINTHMVIQSSRTPSPASYASAQDPILVADGDRQPASGPSQ